MDDYQSLKHTKWECKYHVVFIPKCRRKILYGKLRRHLGEIFKELASQKECQIEEGHLKINHVHMLISVPPKYAVAQVVGYLKGKSAIHIARTFGEGRKTLSERTSGPEDTLFRRSVEMKQRSESTSRNKNMRITASINLRCSNKDCHLGWLPHQPL